MGLRRDLGENNGKRLTLERRAKTPLSWRVCVRVYDEPEIYFEPICSSPKEK